MGNKAIINQELIILEHVATRSKTLLVEHINAKGVHLLTPQVLSQKKT